MATQTLDFSSVGGKPVSPAATPAPTPAPTPSPSPSGGSPIDFSSIGGTRVGAVPQSAADDGQSLETPISENDKGAGAGIYRGVSGPLGLPANIWHAITTEPASDEEKQVEALSGRGGLAIHRLIAEPMQREHEIANSYQKIADSHKQRAEELMEPGTTGHPWWDQTLGRFIELASKDPAQEASNHAQRMANMHRIAGLVPLIGPYADQITQHFLQGDKSGGVAELLTALAIGKATDSVTKGAAKQISKVAPSTGVVAGEEVPIMKGQEKGAAPIARKVAVVPDPETKIADAQQAGAQRGVQNVATEALNKQLSRVGRDEVPAPKQLPAPADGGQPFVFTIPGDMPEEVLEGGSGVVRAGKALAPKNEIAAASNMNSPEQVRQFSEQAAQKLFNKPYDSLSVSDKMKAVSEATNLQNQARAAQPGASVPNANGGQGVAHGSGGASVEELARNEKFWRIKKNGTLSYNGVSPDANLQDGEVLVGVKPDGTLRVQANRTPFSDSEAIDKLGPKVSVAARAGRQLNVTPMRPGQPIEPPAASARPNYGRRWQYLDSPEPGAATQNSSIRGQGTLHTSDPVAAQNTLDALKTIKNPSDSAKMAIQSLSDQLQKYHGYDDATAALKNPEAQLAHGQPRPAIPKSGKATSFADAATQTKAAAQPTFKRLDQLSNGEFGTLQNKINISRQAMHRATSVEDLENAQSEFDKANRSVYDLMQKHSAEFQPNELRNAQLAWKDMQVLNDIHGYVEKAFSAPESVASKSNLVSRTLDGKQLTSQLNQMTSKLDPADIERVLGPDGLKNLYEIGRIAGDPAGALKLGSAMEEIGGYVGKTVKTPSNVRNVVARGLATSPRVSSMLIQALRAGSSPKIYGPLIANAIQKATQDEQGNQAADEIYSELTAK